MISDEKAVLNRTLPSVYLNRDLSWLEFNWRVLQEAQDTDNLLLERAHFLAIVSTNLEEFMSVRVAGIQDQIRAGYTKKDFTGYTPIGLYKRLLKKVSKMINEQYRTFRDISKLLSKEGIVFSTYDELNDVQQEVMDQYYQDIIFPVLTPMAVDQSRPFPLVHSQYVYLSVVLSRVGNEGEEPYFAILQIPSNLARCIALPHRSNSKKRQFIFIEDLIKQHIHTLFSGYSPIAVHEFRITRNSDLTINEEGAEDLLEEIEKELRKRRWGSPVCLEVEKGIHPYALSQLQSEFEITDFIIEIDGPLDLSFLHSFAGSLKGFSHLSNSPIEPVYPLEFDENEDFFEVLRERDVLVYHPYESFEAVTDFIIQASEDEHVMAIKMTLYRVSGNSPLIQALATAAESGKQVTVVVELKARFDEERNIAWARKLEKSGCHVVYGLIGLKTHAKITLIVRQEDHGLQRYVHVGTGNYNDSTAKVYTDLSLFTSNHDIGIDASELFNQMTGYSNNYEWDAITVAPSNMSQSLFKLIRREAEHAAAGRPASIIAKMNSLSNQEMIDELYAASQAGVHIDLIVRGVCCLRPGVPGLSEHITVRSIVDRFLEHSRIYYFENGGTPEVWISSADWMTRNLTRRIELMCPVYDPNILNLVSKILQLTLKDNVKSRFLQSSGSYEFSDDKEAPFRSQYEAMKVKKWKKN
ncbi:polyphosphate kinase 1 [Paenibacillus macquariensis]|uniref:Polyphosphate kinase n=1 Tax=Paenibacillus macquariensis TaxID=948756 RepID=A0ABY1K7K7_9BACL|nr:polyphosphate kinase 1 [Paenibacillus macquariensis]MEC0091111.1 polyphosphate kinase 1 [Paenibacillus macquariensis]OAB33705.1 RNA degradosome polyphosphate kinase [Paenibacillus macquariensis subsp. macquariensis]SIR37623.1 polyphosphate kinase [Paenibacillus macquariensis]